MCIKLIEISSPETSDKGEIRFTYIDGKLCGGSMMFNHIDGDLVNIKDTNWKSKLIDAWSCLFLPTKENVICFITCIINENDMPIAVHARGKEKMINHIKFFVNFIEG